MENKLISVPLKYGIIGGGFLVVLFLAFYFLDMDPLTNVKVVDAIVICIFTFFALKEFRDRYNQRQLHFWQGMTVGMINYLCIALISAVFILVMTSVIDTNMVADYIAGRVALLTENKENLIETMNKEAFQKAIMGVKETTSFDLALDDFLKKSIIGLFLTIIISVILRK